MSNKITEVLKSKYKYIAMLIAGILCVVASTVTVEQDTSTSLEQKLKNTLEMAEGVGDVDVMLTFNDDSKVEGAIIVADGAENVAVKKILHDSAVAVLSLPDYKVQVLIKKK